MFYFQDRVPAVDLQDESSGLKTRGVSPRPMVGIEQGLVEVVPLVNQTLSSAGQSIPMVEKEACVLLEKVNQLSHRRHELREMLKDQKLTERKKALEGPLEADKAARNVKNKIVFAILPLKN
ncbi:cGMP-dependent 3',5'-cyclic phosphodiesterase [Striga asiatica]|uniref:cGMP-dependent 3',5'-cyclic phosphodiesterase n=1 Tax=Striga asiatica TaxID=4170 RepID=A0A5A7PYD8_STRAF|nr:cGMP-dependent 3',5'-cyclic phosphodiesterase [Striga asiatica]